MSRELAGVALIVAGTAARRCAKAAATVALLAVLLVMFVWAAALAGRSSPASPCWLETNAQAVRACFARTEAP